MSDKIVRTAIFPVAGMGTRFLPATKATPKELLPILDTPLLQYAIDEARDAGIERMIFVNHPSKSAIEKYVYDDHRLRRHLLAKGKEGVADRLHRAALSAERDDVIFTLQKSPKGLGHAVLCAREFALEGPVAVILPDDLILGSRGCLSEMIEAYSDIGTGHMVATERVARERTTHYGILKIESCNENLLRASGLVEKPLPEDAPSCDAVVGRYILDPTIFSDLKGQDPGCGNEIQLTDAIDQSSERVGLSGFRFSGTRFDCGSKEGMLSATLFCAANDPECKSVLHAYNSATVKAA